MARLTVPLIAIAVVLVTGYLAFSLSPGLTESDPAWRLKPDDPVITASGSVLYQEHCAACHGVALEGQPDWRTRNADGKLPAPPHDASGHTWHHDDEALFKMTKKGIQFFAGPDYLSDMPAYEGVLTDQEIVAVLSYIKSQWPENVREAHDQINGLHLEN